MVWGDEVHGLGRRFEEIYFANLCNMLPLSDARFFIDCI